MEKIRLIKKKEDGRRIIYTINQDFYIIDDKKFKIMNNTSNLSTYLNKNGTSLIQLLNTCIGNKCIHCNKDINKNRFERKQFITYKFCETCDIQSIVKLYRNVPCIICGKNVNRKNIIYSTCGDNICISKYRQKINNNISSTHWVNNSNNYDEIIKKRTNTRLKNDKNFNRKYVAWNKGKTGIYSKETIEKIRNSVIKQMKEGRIKKTGQEKIFENFLINNNINYIYSFIYEKRQYDFLLIDYNLVIELQGDYWHGNPLFWDVDNNDNSKKQLYETQIMKKKDDIIKKSIINYSKYNFVEFWEYDIHNNFCDIVNILKQKYKIKIN